MAEVTVTAPPPLATVPNVELIHTGTWELSTGTATFTLEDLAAAVGALDCPAVRRPILKLGHTPNPLPGQPAVGFIANMATAENGRTLVGDYVGMPGWLGTEDIEGRSVLSSAYPDRSIEAAWDFRCQLGHTHPFVVHAVALLGDEPPGIGTLQSLQDIGELYGVAAQASAGMPVTITVRAAQEDRVPNPRATQVAAGVSTEDVRRAFYASPAGSGWTSWIEEMQLEPLQLIVMDDTSGTRTRIPVQIGDGDGEEAVSFGDAVKVVIRYDDATSTAASAPSGGTVIRFASRDESRPPTPRTPAAAASGPSEKGAGMDPAKIREALGLKADASDEEVRTAWSASQLATPVPPPGDPAQDRPASTDTPAATVTAGKKAEGTITIDASAWQEREDRIKRLEATDAKRRRDERDEVIAQAVRDGKFPPARKEHWARMWDTAQDPETVREVIAGLARNVIPVGETGYAGDVDDESLDAEFAHLFPPAAGAGKGR